MLVFGTYPTHFVDGLPRPVFTIVRITPSFGLDLNVYQVTMQRRVLSLVVFKTLTDSLSPSSLPERSGFSSFTPSLSYLF